MRIITPDLIFYCTQNQLCATVDSQCLEYLGYITLPPIWQTFDSERSEAIVIHKADNIYQKGFAKLPLSTHLGFFFAGPKKCIAQ